ncbi:MAG: lytic transglycosylase domain-containing protein [Rhodospirillales bacterium]|nr:lytic transglycosylase domain-containing protein [Rhodospirillales bacterium]
MINDPQTALNAISGKTVRPDVVQGLKTASEKTGVSFDFLVAEATRESGLNPNAKAPTTSARGLFQFTSQTWLEVFKANGAKYGQGDLAKKIKRGEDGALEVADDQTRRTILGMRQDPEMSALMAAEYAVANEKRLESRLGREVGPSDLYLAHFLGPNGAARFIDASAKSPDKAAAKLMPAAARHNHSVFFEGSRPRTVAAVYGQVKASIDGTIQKLEANRAVASAEPAAAQPVPDSQKLAAARAEAAERREIARQALASQLTVPTGPSLALATSSSGAESESPLFGGGTPRVSLPMPPPLPRQPEAQATNPGALENLMRRVRLSFLG